eukprot:12506243-Alexandrium_andersonii.AAC.1
MIISTTPYIGKMVRPPVLPIRAAPRVGRGNSRATQHRDTPKSLKSCYGLPLPRLTIARGPQVVLRRITHRTKRQNQGSKLGATLIKQR